MRRAWLIVVAACGPHAPAEPLYHDKPVAHGDAEPLPYRDRVLVPRPELDLAVAPPNLDEELRWPLAGSSHPALEPRYAIGAALAEPVAWTDLCRRGIQSRHAPTSAGQEQIEYLRAWCSVANHDLDGAVGHFATLAHPLVAGLGAAVTLDFADVLVDGCAASEALHLLAKHTVVAPEVLDTLAATYFEVDRLDDAVEINSRALLGPQTEPARCHRGVRAVVLASPYERKARARELSALERNTKSQPCRELDHAASCWADPADGCEAYLRDQNADRGNVPLFGAYYGWPAHPAGWPAWHALAELAIQAAPLPGADRLAIGALEASLLTSHCDLGYLSTIAHQAARLATHTAIASDLGARFAALRDANAASCEQLDNLRAPLEPQRPFVFP